MWVALFLLGLAVSGECYVNYDGYSVLRVIPNTPANLQQLEELQLEYDFWKDANKIGAYNDIMIPPGTREEMMELFELSGMDVAVYVDDVGDLIKQKVGDRTNSKNFDFFVYHTLAEIELFLEDTAGEFSEYAELIDVGESYEGRKIKLLKISTGEDRPAYWIDSAIHSREWVAPAVTLYFIDQLLNGYGVDETVTNLMDSYDFYILPVFNPDGYEYTWTDDRLWRKTRSPNEGSLCMGCDPNRNWDVQWGSIGSSSNPCTNTFHGAFPFSEIEVSSVVLGYLENVPNLQAYFAYHSYGLMFMTPWGYTSQTNPDFDDQIRLCNTANDALRAVHGENYRCDSLINLVGANSGGSVDYVYDIMGIKYSYGVELRDNGRFGFVLPEEEIQPTCEENWAFFTTFATELLDEINK